MAIKMAAIYNTVDRFEAHVNYQKYSYLNLVV